MQTSLWVRIALLLASSTATHFVYTAPNAAPTTDEQAKYKTTSPVGERGFTVVRASPVIKAMIYIINLVDFISLLSSAGLNVRSSFLSFSDQLDTHTIPPAVSLGTLLMCIGATIRVLCYLELGRHFTFQLSIKKGHKLITSGPYSVVRHPGYTGTYINVIGTALAILGPGSIYDELGLWSSTLGWMSGLSLSALLVYMLVGITLRTPKEDLALKTQFHDEWDAWASRTPYRLFPGIF